jgi:predicted transcriptional regulator
MRARRSIRRMTLTIELSQELARRLEEEAARHGQEPAEYVRAALEEKLAAAGPGREASLYAGLPRRSPRELVELAQQQGAPVAVRFEDLLGDFWPEDESADEFIATLREWRREGREAPHD